MVSTGLNLVDLNLAEGNPNVQLSFNFLPNPYLSVAYLSKDPAFYFCNPLNRGNGIADDRCWRLKLGEENFEEV